MKKILTISFLGLFILLIGFFVNDFMNIKGVNKNKVTDEKVIALFDYHKALPELDMFIGSKVSNTYKYLIKNLTNDCEVLYGKERMDTRGVISANNPERDFLNYENEKNIQVLCKGVKYKFLDKQGKSQEQEITLMFNTCNYKVVDYFISTELDVDLFGESPKIFNDWLKYYNNYSTTEANITKDVIEEEFLGEKNRYEIINKTWYHDLKNPETGIKNSEVKNNEEVNSVWPLYGNILISIGTKKDMKNSFDQGVNIITMRSYLSHIVRASNC